MKVLIPTMLTPTQLKPQFDEIRAVTPDVQIIASCLDASASVNRNRCLEWLDLGETAVMLDDDIRGFYPGWIDDLLKGLEIQNAVAVSARLLNPNGTIGPTCAYCPDHTTPEVVLRWVRSHCIMPTAAIAFVHRGHRFPESMIGSGWEDNFWMAEYAEADPDAVFIQSNRCRLIHHNEAKNQKGAYWDHNKAEFFKRWPQGISGRIIRQGSSTINEQPAVCQTAGHSNHDP